MILPHLFLTPTPLPYREDEAGYVTAQATSLPPCPPVPEGVSASTYTLLIQLNERIKESLEAPPGCLFGFPLSTHCSQAQVLGKIHVWTLPRHFTSDPQSFERIRRSSVVRLVKGLTDPQGWT